MNMPSAMRFDWVMVAWLLMAMTVSPTSQAVEFAAHGELDYSVDAGIGRGMMRRKLFFELEVDGCRFSIKSVSSNAIGAKLAEAAMEHKILYRTLTVLKPNDSGRGTNSMSADATYRALPLDDGSCANYLWFAYCSSCYFAERKTNWLKPIWLLDDPSLEAHDFVVPASITLLPGGLLPQEVIFYNDGYWRGLVNQKSVVEQWAKPFDQGFTNAVYTVLESTNMSGTTLPLRWVFTRYGVRRNRVGEWELVALTSAAASVKGISPAAAHGPFRPMFSGAVEVSDTTFARSNPPLPTLYYHVTNGMWPSKDRLASLYARGVERRTQLQQAFQRQEAISHDRRNVVLAAIVATTLFWIVYAGRRWRKRR